MYTLTTQTPFATIIEDFESADRAYGALMSAHKHPMTVMAILRGSNSFGANTVAIAAVKGVQYESQ